MASLEKIEMTSCPKIRVAFYFQGLITTLLEKENANLKLVVVHEEEDRPWYKWDRRRVGFA